MAKFKHSGSLSGRIAIVTIIVGAVGALAAIALDLEARSKVPTIRRDMSASEHPAEASRKAVPEDFSYFPEQFKSPEGAPSEPIDTF